MLDGMAVSPTMLRETTNPNSLITERDDGTQWSLGLLEWSNIIKYLTLEEFYKTARLCHYIGDNLLFYSYVMVLPLWESSGSTWPLSISRCTRVATRFPYLQQIVCRGGAVTNCDTALTRIATYLLPELHHLRLLDLRGCSITEEGAMVLADELPSCPTLRELRLGSNSVGSTGAQALSAAIVRQWHQLPSRTASTGESHQARHTTANTAANTTGPRARYDSSAHNVVHTLDVSSNGIGNPGVVALGALLQEGVPLRGLDVWGNNIPTKTLCALCRQIVAHGAAHLQRLDVGRNQLSGTALASIVQVLESDVHLEHLGLEQTFLGGVYAHRAVHSQIAAVIAAVAHCPTLTSLDFTGHGIEPEEVVALVRALQVAAPVPSVSALSFSSSSSSSSASSYASRQLKYAQYQASPAPSIPTHLYCIGDLFLGSNKLGEEGAVVLAQALENGMGVHLRALGLGGNGIQGDGAFQLIQAYLRTSSDTWKLLDLSHNSIGPNIIEQAHHTANQLGELLHRHKRRRRLDLSGNPCVVNGVGGGGFSVGGEEEEEEEEDDDLGGSVVPNLWTFSAWFGPSGGGGGDGDGGGGGGTNKSSMKRKKMNEWTRTLRQTRGVVVLSTVESAPGSSKLHGLSLHTWQGRLRKQLSNFKGLESDAMM
jgi:Ran GTPase-activating protein (RanGAP) involved in mRNA processing and transport